MYNWRKKVSSNDPNNLREQINLNNFIKYNSQEIKSWEEVILEKCRGQNVLDIGGIAHNKRQIKSSNWKHKKIKNIAQKVVGVDILAQTINWINEYGYNFQYCDATSKKFLGEKFDVVHLGDMIEHVSNIDGLLKFAKRHVADNGLILIQTCNPHYYRTVCSYFPWIKGYPQDNMEHVCWITPNNMNELCFRAKLNYCKTYWQTENMNRFWESLLPIELRSYSYIFELRK